MVKSKERRGHLAFIFKQRDKGVSHNDLLSRIEVLEKKESRGKDSEQNVNSILKKIPIVERCWITPRWGGEDKAGIDLKVVLIDKLGVGKVYVQVKSSEFNIQKEKRKMKIMFNLDTDEELDNWMVENKRIIINGQAKEQEIIDSFLAQVQAICKYNKILNNLKCRENQESNKKLKMGPVFVSKDDYLSALFNFKNIEGIPVLNRSVSKFIDDSRKGFISTLLVVDKNNNVFIEQGEGRDKVTANNIAAQKMLETLLEGYDYKM